jgi:hypothetical protein
MSPERWLVWADRAYFGMAIAAAIATALTIVAGIAQNRLAARIADAKDRAFADFKLNTEAQARTLNAAVADANARAAEANRVAEEERLARVKIEAGLASRRLGPDREPKFIASLIAFRGSLPAINVTILGDLEAREFGVDLAKAIQRAGVPVRFDETGVMVPPPYGLLITDTPSGALKAAFEAAGVPQVTYASAVSAVPTILVGLKPPAF